MSLYPSFNGFMLRVQNQCFFRGVYTPEDDWEYDEIAETKDDAAKKFWLKFPRFDIYPAKFTMYEVEYIVARGEKIVVSMTETDYDYKCEAFQRYKQVALDERAKRIEEAHQQHVLKMEAEKEKLEREKLEELRRKYE